MFKSGSEAPLTTLSTLPRAELLQGVLLHVPWRKAKQTVDAWIPLSCPVTIQRLLDHEASLRAMNFTSPRLFPSVQRSKGNPPHPRNFFGSTQFRQGLRKSLKYICGMSDSEVKAYGGHSLRVGGSNFMRRLGIDSDIHRIGAPFAATITIYT